METIDFFTADTPNGYKAAIVLEELGLSYRAHKLNLIKGDQFKQTYTAIAPAGRIPAIRYEEDGEELNLYGSEAIALHLTDREGKFLPKDRRARAKAYEMAAFVSSDLALPMAVQFQVQVLIEGEHPDVVEFFKRQARRMYEVMDKSVDKHDFMAGDEYTVADMLALPAVKLSAARVPGILDGLDSLKAWRDRIAERPAVAKALSLDFAAG